MKNLLRYIIFGFILILGVNACKDKDDPEIPYLGLNYYPDEIGHWVIYDVDSTYKYGFDLVTHHAHYQIKEIITDTFLDNEGRKTLRLERYRKDSMSYPDWTIYQVWTANKTASNLERYEDNYRYVKLQFPLTRNATWNGNSKNTLNAFDYIMTDVHETETVGKLLFDSVSTVLHTDDTLNLIERTYEYEKYATNAGLVYRYSYRLEQQPVQGQPNVYDTTLFTIYKETVLDYKK